jgi:hypothetical protein
MRRGGGWGMFCVLYACICMRVEGVEPDVDDISRICDRDNDGRVLPLTASDSKAFLRLLYDSKSGVSRGDWDNAARRYHV